MAAKRADRLRKIEIVRDYTRYAAGSALIKWGNTWVLCTASVGDKVPPFRKETGKGWVTAEYSMLPGSTPDRKARDISKLKLDSRSTEIQRLIGRSLRAAVDFDKLAAVCSRTLLEGTMLKLFAQNDLRAFQMDLEGIVGLDICISEK